MIGVLLIEFDAEMCEMNRMLNRELTLASMIDRINFKFVDSNKPAEVVEMPKPKFDIKNIVLREHEPVYHKPKIGKPKQSRKLKRQLKRERKMNKQFKYKKADQVY